MTTDLPILIIEDDVEDQEILLQAIDSLGITNPLKFLQTGEEAMDFLQHSFLQPLVILCDIKMPGMDGFQLRRRIADNPELKVKSIPFIFYTNVSDQKIVVEAYHLTVQGFFLKPGVPKDLKKTLQVIVDYWKHSLHPNSF